MNKIAFTYDDVRVTPDRQIGIHSHPQWELSHVIYGDGTRTIGDRREQIVKGEVILLPPNIPHVWQFDSSVTDNDGCIANITVFFEDNTLNGLSALLPEMKDSIDKIRMQTEAISYSGATLENIVSILYSLRNKTAEARIPYMFRLLRFLSDTSSCLPVGSNNTLTRTEMRMERIRTFCACNYARDINLDEIARYAGMNRSAFCTFMKRYTGHTFSEYMNELRLNLAVERIKNTDESIAEIAFSVGFSNVTYFNRLFRNKYKCTPKTVRMDTINTELRTYVEQQIIPRYALFDKAHQADHVNMVIEQSIKLARSIPGINTEMVYVTAAFHDLGLVNGRENHHIDSRKILETDEFIKARFSQEQIRLMGEAVEDHRASKSDRPRNDYGLIVAEADRFINGETIIRRTIQYGLKNYPDLDREGHYRRTLEHLKRKYGRNGYLKIWLPWSDNAKRLESLRQMIDNPEVIYKMFDRIFREETRN